MTTTVGMLLDDVHARAWDLCSELGDRRVEDFDGDRVTGLLAAWPRLATAALRVLDVVPLEPAWLDDMGSVRLVLGEVGRGVLEATADNGSAAACLKPDPAVGELALRLGLIADLLVGEKPARTEVDWAALEGLQANVVSIVHAVATVSLPLLQDRDHLQASRSVLAVVLARTERFAMIPAEGRIGRYEDVGAVTSKSLDAAISTWAHATVDILRSRRGVSQAALQVAAGDALILTAAAGTVCSAASQLGVLDTGGANVAGSALGAAHAAWRRPTSWPSTVRLEGVRDLDHIRASRQVRQLVTDNLREGKAWLTPDRMADQFDVRLLMGTLRRGMHAVSNVALILSRAENRHTQPQYQRLSRSLLSTSGCPKSLALRNTSPSVPRTQSLMVASSWNPAATAVSAIASMPWLATSSPSAWSSRSSCNSTSIASASPDRNQSAFTTSDS